MSSSRFLYDLTKFLIDSFMGRISGRGLGYNKIIYSSSMASVYGFIHLGIHD